MSTCAFAAILWVWRQRNPQLKDAKFLTPAPGRPKVFVPGLSSIGLT